MIDAHVHFWKYHAAKDAWITDDMRLLQKDFFPNDLVSLLRENNVDGIVAVQADQSENETQFLIDLSKEFSFIKGIVGWTDLQSAHVEERLNFYSQQKIIKGFRHIIQGEAKGFLQKEKFLNGVRALQLFDFTYDLLIYENQLREAIEFVNKFPDQKIIIDHCAKPSIRGNKIEKWKDGIKEIAENENVYCKVSGLITEAVWNQWNENVLYPYLDVVFEYFGTKRLLFGSDWPVMLLSGTYSGWMQFLQKYLEQFPQKEIQNIFTNNAIQFYSLKPTT